MCTTLAGVEMSISSHHLKNVLLYERQGNLGRVDKLDTKGLANHNRAEPKDQANVWGGGW